MGSVTPYKTAAGERRYRVRYRTPDRRQTDKRGFKTKRDADLFLASVEVSKARGEYVDPSASKLTVGELGPAWLAARANLKPSSLRPLEIAWRVYVHPEWANWRLSDIAFSDVQAWVALLSAGKAKTTKKTSTPLAATSVLRAHAVLAGILDVAVKDRRISSNPARGVVLPRKKSKRRAYLTVEQVELLARKAGEHGTLVLFLAYTGLRWGEAIALRLRDLHTLKRRVHVQENAVRVGAKIIVGTPKTHEDRSVPYPAFLSVPLAEASEGKRRDELVFGNGDSFVRALYGRRPWFAAAVQAAQEEDASFPRVTIHDLRHTAASLAISAGANVKAVQKMLGHKSAAMTLDVYADLFDDDLDAVATALDDARTSRLRA